MKKQFKRPENTITISQDSRAIAKHFGYKGKFIRCGECDGSGTILTKALYSVGKVRCGTCRGCGYFIKKNEYNKYVKPNKKNVIVNYHIEWSKEKRNYINTPEVIPIKNGT